MSHAKPSVTITSPIVGSNYRGGDVISFSGEALGANGNVLDASSFTWYDTFGHAEHLHDGPPMLEGSKSGTYTISRTNEVDANVYYRFTLVVFEGNESDTAQVDIFPYKSVITITSNIPDAKFSLAGTSGLYTMPVVRNAVENMQFVIVTSSKSEADTNLIFSNWKDGNCSTAIFLSIPQNDTLIEANYVDKSLFTTTSSITSYEKQDGNQLFLCGKTVTSTLAPNQCLNKLDSVEVCSIKTSIENIVTKPPFALYPNPFQDFISLKLHNEKLIKIEIYNMYGKKVAEGVENHLNLSFLSPAYYFASITTDSHIYSTQLIKLQ